MNFTKKRTFRFMRLWLARERFLEENFGPAS